MKESKPVPVQGGAEACCKERLLRSRAKETDGGSGGEGGRMTMKEAIAAKLGMGADEKGE